MKARHAGAPPSDKPLRLTDCPCRSLRPIAGVGPRCNIALLVLTLLAVLEFVLGRIHAGQQGLLHDPRLAISGDSTIWADPDHSYWWPSGESGLYRPLHDAFVSFQLRDAGRWRSAGWLSLAESHPARDQCASGFSLLLRFTKIEYVGFIAAAWAVHPALTESVTNIVGRADFLPDARRSADCLMYLKSAES